MPANTEDVFDRIVIAFESLADDIDALKARVNENALMLKTAPSEARLSQVRAEILHETVNMNREALARIEEKLGAVREAILTETAKAHHSAASEAARWHEEIKGALTVDIADKLHGALPGHVAKVIEKRDADAAEARAIKRAQLKASAQMWTSLVLFAVSIATLAMSFFGGIPKQIPAAAKHAERAVQ